MGLSPAEGAELRTFIVRLTALLRRATSDLVMARGLNDGYRHTLKRLIDENVIGTRAQEILDTLDSPTGEVPQALHDHGLDEGSTELRFKLAAFNAAVQRSGYVETRSGDPLSSAPVQLEDVHFEHRAPVRSESRLHKVLSGLASAFKVANSIVKSLSHAIPAAGAYGEIKDGVEEGIDTAASGVGLVRRGIYKFLPKRKSKTAVIAGN
jgi:hypothetical protein